MTAPDPARIAAYERGFRRAGLPLFIEDFSAAEDVFNRAAPLLGLIFLAEMLGAGDLDWTWWQNVAAVIGGLAVLLVAAGFVNRARGRPFNAVPDRLGKTELAAFVLIPALLPLIFGGQVGSALGTAAGNLAVLAAIYAVVALGLLAILRWVLARIVSQLASALGLVAKAVPLLAIFALLSFATEEIWVIFSRPTDAIYATLAGLFVLLGTAFLVVRIPREARRLEADAGVDTPPLRRRQLFNVGLVLLVSQGVQVLLVSITVGLFFTVFGTLAIDDGIRAAWLGTAGNELFAFELFGERLEVTEELLRVAGGLAAFSGFYFAIAIFTDSTYRTEFLDEMSEEMRSSFRERAEYLALLGR